MVLDTGRRLSRHRTHDLRGSSCDNIFALNEESVQLENMPSGRIGRAGDDDIGGSYMRRRLWYKAQVEGRLQDHDAEADEEEEGHSALLDGSAMDDKRIDALEALS